MVGTNSYHTSNIRSSLVESPDLPKAPLPPPAIPFNTRALTPFPLAAAATAAPAALSSPPSSLPSPPALRRALAPAPAAFGAILRNPPLCRCGDAALVLAAVALLKLPDEEVPPFSCCRGLELPLASPGPFPLARTPPLIAPAPAPADGNRMMILPLPPPVFAVPLEEPPPAAAGAAVGLSLVPVAVAAAATGAPRLLRAVSPCRCRFNRSSRICGQKMATQSTKEQRAGVV